MKSIFASTKYIFSLIPIFSPEGDQFQSSPAGNNKLIGHSCSFSVVFNNDQKRALYSIYLLAAIGNNRYEAPVTFGEDCYAAPSTKLRN